MFSKESLIRAALQGADEQQELLDRYDRSVKGKVIGILRQIGTIETDEQMEKVIKIIENI